MPPLLLAALAVKLTLDHPPVISGNCNPARVHFTSFSKAESLPVTYDWLLKGPADGWVVLHVISPQAVHSDKVRFQVTCGK